MRRPTLGEHEMEVLRFITEHAPVTTGQVAEQYGAARGLARTTVQTVMERLRKKGYLVRKRQRGVFHYSPRLSQADVLQGLLHRFIEETLGGSLAPVVTYLNRTRRLTPAELAELRQLVEELREAGGEEPE